MALVKANYHTHSLFCDGKEPLENYVREAEKQHFDQLGFSSHAPVPFENNFSIQEDRIPEYCKEIDSLKAQTTVTLLKALECDFIPGVTKHFEDFKNTYSLDYIIGGVHLVKPANRNDLWFIDGSKREIYDEGLADLFGNNVRKAVTTFWEQTFEMLETEKMDVIAHFDKIKMHNQHRFFQEDEKWYTILADEALRLIKRQNVVVEINTRGLYKKRCDAFYPSTELLQKACKMDIPVIISSDAHKSEEISLFFKEAEQELHRCGFRQIVHFDPQKKMFLPALNN